MITVSGDLERFKWALVKRISTNVLMMSQHSSGIPNAGWIKLGKVVNIFG